MIIPVSDVVLLPGSQYSLLLSGLTEEERRSIAGGEHVFALPMKQVKSRAELRAEDFNPVGVWVEVTEAEDQPQGVRITFKALKRVRFSEITVSDQRLDGAWTELDEILDLSEENRAEMLATLKNTVGDIAERFPQGKAFMQYMSDIGELNELMVFQSQFMALSNEDRYSLMETSSLKERSLRFLELLLQNKAAATFQLELVDKLSEENQRRYREAALRKQLRAIQEELGEAEDGQESGGGQSEWSRRIAEAHMPEAVEKEARKQLERLERQPPGGHETDSILSYLELLTALAWQAPPAGDISITESRRVLEEQHYGLGKVKDRILQHLSVMQLKGGNSGSILLLVGPPGTGKTSLGKSIAQALGRKYVRVSLGGVRDESEIRGHRRTYVGAMPGRIIQEMKRVGVMDPVMVLDEVDKLQPGGFSGDPAGALLEVLDPEQNNSFTDHYLNLPYDLSHVFFICTANSLDTIPQPLLDRMEVIQVSGYTTAEKLEIGRRHLLPKALADHGLTAQQLELTDEALKKLISDYTMESGVRGLKKKIDAVCRAAAAKIVEQTAPAPIAVDAQALRELLDQRAIEHEAAAAYNPPGVVTGLAYTPVGGDILFIEAASIPGSGQVILTGKLGDVMKESAAISVSLLKSRLPVSGSSLKERDIHVHVPSGAVPKDGPSAGITLLVSLVSMATGIPVDPKLAMTGEVTLRGSVMPIGGLKEKLMAAERAGIRKVLIPGKNAEDLRDVPDTVKEKLEIRPVDTVDDLLQEVFGPVIHLTEGEHYQMVGMLPVPVRSGSASESVLQA